MPNISNFACTSAQREIVDQHQGLGHRMFEDLVHAGLKARAALVVLPHVNEDCEQVLHGANMHIRSIYRTYLAAAQSLASSFPRQRDIGEEYFPYMVLRQGGKLPDWMQRCIDRNGGVIPETWLNSDVAKE